MEAKAGRVSPNRSSPSSNFIVREVYDPFNFAKPKGSPELIPKKTFKFFSPNHTNTWDIEARTCDKIMRFFHKPKEEKAKLLKKKLEKLESDRKDEELEQKKKAIAERISDDRNKIRFNQKLRRTLQKECEQKVNCWVEDEAGFFSPDELRVLLNSRSKERAQVNLHGFANNLWNDMSKINAKNTKILLSGCVIKREEELVANLKKKMSEEEGAKNMKREYLMHKKEENREKLRQRHAENILLEKKSGRNMNLIDNITLEHIPAENLDQEVSNPRLGFFPLRYRQTAEEIEFRRLQNSPSIHERLIERRMANKKNILDLHHYELEGIMIAELDNIKSTANVEAPMVKAIMSSPVCKENVESMKKKSRQSSENSRPKTARKLVDSNSIKYMPEHLLREKFVLTKTLTDFQIKDDDREKLEELNDEIGKFQKAAQKYKKGFCRKDLSVMEKEIEQAHRK